MLSAIILLVCRIFYNLWHFFTLRWCGQESTITQPPIYPGYIPLIGHSHYVFGDRIRLWNGIKKFMYFSLEQGGAAIIYLGTLKIYMITDPDDCVTVSNSCLYRPFVFKFTKPWLDVGLVTIDPPLWKSLRKIFHPIFNQRSVNVNMGVFNEQSRNLVTNLAGYAGKGKFSPAAHFMIHTLDTILQITYGADQCSDTGDDSTTNLVYCETVNKLLDLCATRMMNPLLHVPFFFNCSSHKREFDKLATKAMDMTRKRIEQRKLKLKKLEENGDTIFCDSGPTKPFCDVLINLADKKNTFSYEEIRDHIETITMAAFDTTAKAMIFIMALLGAHRDVQDRVYKELREILGDADRDLDRHDLTRVEYLDAVVKESLRLFPPIPLMGRAAMTDIKLKNCTIPKGSAVGIGVYCLHRHSVWGADAEEFRPERWLEHGGVPENANTFAAFGIGIRNCIGKVHAMALLKTAIAHLIRRYRISADITKIVVELNSSLKPVANYLFYLFILFILFIYLSQAT